MGGKPGLAPFDARQTVPVLLSRAVARTVVTAARENGDRHLFAALRSGENEPVPMFRSGVREGPGVGEPGLGAGRASPDGPKRPFHGDHRSDLSHRRRRELDRVGAGSRVIRV